MSLYDVGMHWQQHCMRCRFGRPVAGCAVQQDAESLCTEGSIVTRQVTLCAPIPDRDDQPGLDTYRLTWRLPS